MPEAINFVDGRRQKYNFVPKYLIYSPKLLYTYISFNLNNGSFIEVNFLF
jgi:hypothetical protein